MTSREHEETSGNELPGEVPDLVSRGYIRSFIINKLAEFRLVEPDKLEEQAAMNGGDLEMKSDEGVAITGNLEGELGRRLAGPENLLPTQFTSLETLTNLIYKQLQ